MIVPDMNTLLIATENDGKKREIQEMLGDVYTLLTLKDIPIKVVLPPETGKTYEENARIKAISAAEKTGYITIADDSGIEVQALPGELGVYSARYAVGTDRDRCEKLLQALQGIKDRRASFVCTIVLHNPKTQETYAFRGELHGTIAEGIIGNEGFGYDPIFIPDGYTTTNAALGMRVKNEISHRKQAIAKLCAFLQTYKSA